MAKISIDLDYIKEGLYNIGYEISDCIEGDNNGRNWQLKFSNSGAIVTIYDTNKTANTLVGGKLDVDEGEKLKEIVDGLKCKDLNIDSLNRTIVDLIRSQKEDYYYDFKRILPEGSALVHDVLCLSNNIENRDAYLVIGVADDYSVVGIGEKEKSHNIYDTFKRLHFAGDHMPELEIHELYYKCKKILVIECKSSKHVPFYLTEPYQGKKNDENNKAGKIKVVHENLIYTRVGDTNTCIDKSASYSDIEKLWRIHFEREHEK